MKPLNPLQADLPGTTLIEASAGTGKTYTITTLYLRLLLEQQLSIDKILVVTFTIAATEELRIKITERVLLALAWLRCTDEQQQAAVGADDTLIELLQRLPREKAVKLLEDAASRLDEAAVYTIDAFCMRVLQDHAFDTGMPYRTDFVADDTEIKTRAVQDFWRHVTGTKSEAYLSFMSAKYPTPDKLAEGIERILRFEYANTIASIDSDEVDALQADVQQLFSAMQSEWNAQPLLIRELLTKSDALKKTSYKVDKINQLFNKFDEWMQQPSVPAKPLAEIHLLSTSKITATTKVRCESPAHPLFDLIDEFIVKHERYSGSLLLLVRLEALQYVRSAVKRFKESRSILHFEDLRSRLFDAINSSSGTSLATHVRRRWPFALIDEFQDTDPQQYHIFSSIYAEQSDDSGLFLIGDPKQAIYSFRGADIFAYIEASRDTPDNRRYTLNTNWRSTAQYVAAVNAIFETPRAPFVFDDEIPFSPVAAAGSADKAPLLLNGEQSAPLQFWLLQPDEQAKKPTITREAATFDALTACAGNIRDILNKANNGDATLGARPVAAADIAVLVRTNQHAAQMQMALRAQSVRSVRLANNGVFESEEARELLVILRAITEPSRTGLVRAALATRILGYTASAIDALNASEAQWDTLITSMLNYQDILEQRGVIACLQQVFVDMGVSQRLLGQLGGEQQLTNLLQMAELLQVKSRDYSTVSELLQWMTTRIENRTIDEELMLRLESDEDLVKIVTIHKSKGLEYPIVYLPVPWDSAPRQQDMPIFHDPETLELCIDPGSEQLSQSVLIAKREAFAESLRLLYVALTRARNLCVVCWGPVAQAQDTSLAYLLHPRINAEELMAKKSALTVDEINADLDALGLACGGAISTRVITEADLVKAQYQPVATADQLSLPAFTATVRSDWRISSYTGLLRNDNSERPDHDSIAPQTDVDDLETALDALVAADLNLDGATTHPGNTTDSLQPMADDDQFAGIFAIPAGARTGEFLHYVFENIDFTAAAGAGNATTRAKAVAAGLDRYGNLGRHEPQRLQELAEACELLVDNTLQANLALAVADGGAPRGSLQLADIPLHHRLNELEFYFTVDNAGVDDIHRILSSEPDYAETASGLSFRKLSGLMHGYIDLVLRHDGRYYIVDYKSNLLGQDLADYNTDSLRSAVKSHRYDLQYLIYTVALHRYLRRCIKDYQYERDFGGVYYLFLRGIRQQRGTGIWFDKPSPRIIEALDQLFALSAQEQNSVAQSSNAGKPAEPVTSGEGASLL